MNKIILLFFGLAIFVAMTVASSAEEDSSLTEEVSSDRQVRDADAGRRIRKRGRKGRKSIKKAKKGKGRKKGKRKSIKQRKQRGKKRNNKLRKKPKKIQVSTRNTTSGMGMVCLSAAVKYMKQWKDVVGNFKRQSSRSTKHSSVGGKKHGKKGVFAPVAHRLVQAGGDNKTNLSCGGLYDNDGAKQLTNLTKLLFDCEIDVNMSCNPANYPKHNDTILDMCTNLTEKFEKASESCMKKTVGKTSDSDYSAACMCWEDSSLADMSTGVADCKIQDTQKEITVQKQKCVAAFAKCRKYEDEASHVMASCSSDKDKLGAKATALSTNKDAVTAAKDKMSALAGVTSGRKVRMTAGSCQEVITKSTQLTILVEQSTSSGKISVIASEISSVSSSVTCTDQQKSDMKTQISSVESSIARISEALDAVQEQLQTLTGSTAMVSGSVSTAAPSGRRDRIRRAILENQ